MSEAPTTAGSENQDGGALDRATLVVAGVVIIGAVMSILDATVVNVALNTLVRELDSTLPTIQWVISGYTLALASVIPISGWAADRFGARRVWLLAVVLFTGASILCALAWSVGALIAFRVLQGIGGGLLTPVGTAIIARAAGPQRMGRVMSLMGVPLLLGPVLGPVLGGLLLQTVSWHWIFLINVPVGAVAIVLGWRLLPRTPGRPTDRLDFVGLLLLSPGLAALIFASPRSAHRAPWAHPRWSSASWLAWCSSAPSSGGRSGPIPRWSTCASSPAARSRPPRSRSSRSARRPSGAC